MDEDILSDVVPSNIVSRQVCLQLHNRATYANSTHSQVRALMEKANTTNQRTRKKTSS